MTVDIERDGEPLDEQAIHPMLPAWMGFHCGANVSLDGAGIYNVTVSIGGTGVRQTGVYRDRFGDPAGVAGLYECSAAARDEISAEEPPNSAGDPLAVEGQTAPQFARHEGFETAFLSVSAAELAP